MAYYITSFHPEKKAKRERTTIKHADKSQSDLAGARVYARICRPRVSCVRNLKVISAATAAVASCRTNTSLSPYYGIKWREKRDAKQAEKSRPRRPITPSGPVPRVALNAPFLSPPSRKKPLSLSGSLSSLLPIPRYSYTLV